MTMPQSSEFPLSAEITRDYNILGLLGKGGMGEVYLAEQLRVGRRRVALKVLNQEYSANPTVMRRFENEAASAGMINHRNVVMIYESRITTDKQIYVAMEYVEGQSLQQLLTRPGTLPLETVIEIVRQSCAGLAAAHKFGIVHRDIKPDNIMVATEDGAMIVKLLDFGIARLAEPGLAEQSTRAGTIIGTPEYMSPEQASGATGDKIDTRSDLYSLGMVVYTMLTGRVAFEGDDSKSYLAILHQHINDDPPRPSLLRPDLNIPAPVEQVVLKALAKDRAQRQQTAREFASELFAAWQQAESFRTGKRRSIQTILDSERKTINGRIPTPQHIEEPVVTVPIALPDPPAPALPPKDTPVSKDKGTSGLLTKWKYLLTGLLVMLVVLVVVLLQLNKTKRADEISGASLAGSLTTTKDPPLPTADSGSLNKVMDYRVKVANAETATLLRDNTVHSGAQIWFEFELAKQGAVYLFVVQPDQSLIWLDAKANGVSQDIPAGRTLLVPIDAQNWWNIDNNPGEEKFLLVYVPAGIRWSLPEVAAMKKLSLSGNAADLSPANAARLREYLSGNAAELSATPVNSGRVVTHTLTHRE